MEELHESEVVWPEGGGSAAPVGSANSAPRSSRKTTARTGSWLSSSAAPMDIPLARRTSSGEGKEEDEDECAPPHVLASRRRAGGKVAFSLCSGIGRTLKGRDLRHVRDSVLRMTGFLE
ncbi:hypothetical protein Cni_G23425 [Canna indica]|uniref:Senescence regulator n=1 Tax=Canna indica TaxID=4628 RepID=A0AAQ3KU08_9LILI|nr:hypothetical protein Cni_G23425 [Canna indica]